MIDLSHTTDEVQLQVLELSQAPVIFSHSSWYVSFVTECGVLTTRSYELCPHPRNVSNAVLQKLSQNGGIIMICFLPELAKTSCNDASINTVADHILYAVRQVGCEHVGIGSDFDGMLEGPEGLDDVTMYPELIAELLNRGLPEEQIEGVMGLNLIRVMAEVEATARNEQVCNNVPLYDRLADVWTPAQKAMLLAKGVQRGSAGEESDVITSRP
jgi:membrane dipeptidase